MVFDSTTSTIIVNIAQKNEISLDKAKRIVDGLFSTVKNIIREEPPGVIKLDYFGKFIHSELYKKKKEEIGRRALEEEMLKKERDVEIEKEREDGLIRY